MGKNNLPASNLVLADIKNGQEFVLAEVMTAQLIDDFARLSGDFSPLHMDDNFARARGFEQRVAHGAILNALMSRLVGMHLPGEHAILHSINTQFVSPVLMGDTVSLRAVVDFVSEATRTITIKVVVTNQTRQTICARAKLLVGFTG